MEYKHISYCCSSIAMYSFFSQYLMRLFSSITRKKVKSFITYFCRAFYRRIVPILVMNNGAALIDNKIRIGLRKCCYNILTNNKNGPRICMTAISYIRICLIWLVPSYIWHAVMRSMYTKFHQDIF